MQGEYNDKLFFLNLPLMDVFHVFTGWFLLRQKEANVWKKNLLKSTPFIEYRNICSVKTTVSSAKMSKSFVSKARSKGWGVLLINCGLKGKLLGHTVCSDKRSTLTPWCTKKLIKLGKNLTAIYEMLKLWKKRRVLVGKVLLKSIMGVNQMNY